jgi:hypothetical protein
MLPTERAGRTVSANHRQRGRRSALAGRVSIYKLVLLGKLEARHFGRATRITRKSINNLIDQ